MSVDVGKMRTVEEVETELSRFKDTILTKLKMQSQLKQEKKDTNAGYRDSIKALQEELDYAVGVIDNLHSRKRELMAKASHG